MKFIKRVDGWSASRLYQDSLQNRFFSQEPHRFAGIVDEFFIPYSIVPLAPAIIVTE